MKTNNWKKIILSLVVVVFAFIIPFLGIFFYNKTSEMNNKEAISVLKNYVQAVTTIGDVSTDSEIEFANRFEFNKTNREISLKEGLDYVSSNSKTITNNNFQDINHYPEYSGALVRQENKGVYINNINKEGNILTIDFDTEIDEYVTFLNPNEEGKNKDTTKKIKGKHQVLTKKRKVILKGLKVKLIKENEKWVVLENVNIETISGQYFSTWKGNSKIVVPSTKFETIESRTYEIEED